jgi:hypothetical protein
MSGFCRICTRFLILNSHMLLYARTCNYDKHARCAKLKLKGYTNLRIDQLTYLQAEPLPILRVVFDDSSYYMTSRRKYARLH